MGFQLHNRETPELQGRALLYFLISSLPAPARYFPRNSICCGVNKWSESTENRKTRNMERVFEATHNALGAATC